MIEEVTGQNIAAAGQVHSEAWRESHKGFCSAEFVAKHTPAAQTEYLRREMAAGKRVFLLTDGGPVGIVSVDGSLIENLYVLPGRQNRGYGTMLLEFAMEQCGGTPTLWILDNNEGACRLYSRHGFVKTGKKKWLSQTLCETEMQWKGEKHEKDPDHRRYSVRQPVCGGVFCRTRGGCVCSEPQHPAPGARRDADRGRPQ